MQDNVTALMAACQNGHTATADLLIAKGADVKAKPEVRQERQAVITTMLVSKS
jgi:ankyrin repeat protein